MLVPLAMFAILGALVALGAVTVTSIIRRKPMWRTSLVLLATTGLLAAFVLDNGQRPLMDDGPFTGKVATHAPTTAVQSSLALGEDRKLESYLPEDSTHAPMVCLWSDTTMSWCRYAEADSGSQVRIITFQKVQGALFSKTIVDGTVEWTFGREHTRWILRGDRLKEYWYSW